MILLPLLLSLPSTNSIQVRKHTLIITPILLNNIHLSIDINNPSINHNHGKRWKLWIKLGSSHSHPTPFNISNIRRSSTVFQIALVISSYLYIISVILQLSQYSKGNRNKEEDQLNIKSFTINIMFVMDLCILHHLHISSTISDLLAL